MIEALRTLARMEAIKAVGERFVVKLGNVSSYDPTTYMVKVQLTVDEESETGWLPLAAMAVGNGWGIFTPPNVGDQVDVHFVDGDRSSGYVSQRIFQRGSVGANHVPAGEYWMVHKTGSAIKLSNDGKISITGTVEIDLGNPENAFSKLLTTAFLAIYAGHTHTCAAPGNPSSIPLQQPTGVTPVANPTFDPDTVRTTTVKAN